MRRALGGHRFGMLERATVEVGEVSLLLSEALGCRWWPLRRAGQEPEAGACFKRALELDPSVPVPRFIPPRSPGGAG